MNAPNPPLPIIGITTYHRTEAGEFVLPGNYVDAIALAGGIPVLLPPHPADSAPLLTALDGLILVAQAEDGLIEAIEHQQHPWLLAVQWHPELSLDAPVHQRFFRGFVESVTAARDNI